MQQRAITPVMGIVFSTCLAILTQTSAIAAQPVIAAKSGRDVARLRSRWPGAGDA